MTIVMTERVLSAAEFKATCLEVMDQVRRTRRDVVITKRGVPVAKLVPIDVDAPAIFDVMKATAQITGDVLAPVADPSDWESTR